MYRLKTNGAFNMQFIKELKESEYSLQMKLVHELMKERHSREEGVIVIKQHDLITKHEEELQTYFEAELKDYIEAHYIFPYHGDINVFDYEIEVHLKEGENEGEFELFYSTEEVTVIVSYHIFEKRTWKLTERTLITIMIDDIQCTGE